MFPTPGLPPQRTHRPTKYGNQLIEHEGMVFHSKGELRRWLELRLLERAGLIQLLRRQVPFPLVIDGKPIRIRSAGYPRGRACRYTADFAYIENGIRKVEEFKGMDDTASRLRRAVVEAIYGIEIEVVR
jgi:hypothetical protein